MIDIASLTRALPVSRLEPNFVALLGGIVDVPKDQAWKVSVKLLEPPAGQHELYLDPTEALQRLLRRNGLDQETALLAASELFTRMTADIPQNRRAIYFDFFEPDPPECVRVSDFVRWLRYALTAARRYDPLQHMLNQIPANIVDFFEQVAEVVSVVPVFRGPDNRDNPWSVIELPSMPPPKAMFEFMPGAPLDKWNELVDWKTTDNPFTRWREAMRPVALSLERALREPVYRFANPDHVDDYDDVHRFLVLHWCLSYRPQSMFCQYLLRNSGAGDVEELKAALINSATYAQPFIMNDTFLGMETERCHVDYIPAAGERPATAAFSHLKARKMALDLLPRKFGARALRVGVLSDD